MKKKYHTAGLNTQPTAVEEIFNREFQRVGIESHRPIFTTGEKAEFLGIDRITLGRFLNQTRPITRKRATQMAEKLRQNKSMASIVALAGEIFSTQIRSQKDTHAMAVEPWFKRQAKDGNLIFVECREPFRLKASGADPDARLVTAISEAVSAGAACCLLFPFPENYLHLKVPHATRIFVTQINMSLLHMGMAVTEAVLKRVFKIHEPSRDGDLRQRLMDAIGRFGVMGVHALEEDTIMSSPGIGWTAFYVRRPPADGSVRRPFIMNMNERWRLVVSARSEPFMLREDNQLDLSGPLLHPVPEYFYDNKRLPGNTEELTAFGQTDLPKLFRQAEGMGDPVWEIVGQTSAEVVDNFLKRVQGRPQRTLPAPSTEPNRLIR